MNRFLIRASRWLPSILVIACCTLAPRHLLAQAANTALISGQVSSSAGAAVAGAQVVVRSNESGIELHRTMTSRQGNYTLSGLPLGAYKLSASAPGFHDSASRLVILGAASASVNLILSPMDAGTSGPGQPAQPAAEAKPSPLAFSPAGVRGSIAPSGYATGLSSEETARVRSRAGELEPSLFASLASPAANAGCAQEPALLRAVQQAPGDFDAHHALGAFYLGHGDYAQAIRSLQAARAVAPGDRANTIDLALALFGANRASDAAVLLEPLVTGSGADATLLRLLALVDDASGQPEKAANLYERAAFEDPSATNQYACGLGLIQLGAKAKARTLFATATAAHPESARLLLGLGIAEQLSEHKDAAVTALLRASDADSNDVAPLSLLSEFADLPAPTQVDLRRRVVAYLVAHPDDAEARLTYALTLSRNHSAESGTETRQEIVRQLQRALALNPRMARAHFLLGDNLADAGDLRAATEEFLAGLKLDPADARAHYRLAQVYRRTGEQERSRQEIEEFRALLNKAGGDSSSTPAALALPFPVNQSIAATLQCPAIVH
jgi:tetratricopeptide (TPR) repeat protein